MERRERRLTPIEFMLILGVLAILGGLVVTTKNERVERHNGLACTTNLRALGRAFSMYATDWHGSFPANSATMTGEYAGEGPWQGQITPYVKRAKALRCPNDPSPPASSPAASRNGAHFTSYPMNPALGSPRPSAAEGRRYAGIKNPHDTMLFADRESWHFRKWGKPSFRNMLLLDGSIVDSQENDFLEKYWGQIPER